MRSSRRGAIQAPPLPFRNEYPQLLNDYSRTEMQNDCKKHKTPPQNCSAAGFTYVQKQPKSPILSGSRRFSGIEKSTVILSKLRWTYGGVGGIRTLGRLLTVTRFPVVLVMTASIPLHDIGWPCQTPDSPNIIHKSCPFVKGYF